MESAENATINANKALQPLVLIALGINEQDSGSSGIWKKQAHLGNSAMSNTTFEKQDIIVDRVLVHQEETMNEATKTTR